MNLNFNFNTKNDSFSSKWNKYRIDYLKTRDGVSQRFPAQREFSRGVPKKSSFNNSSRKFPWSF